MASKAVVSIIGHVGKSAELRYTSNGDAVGTFSVATSTGKGDKEETTWFNVTMFGKTAENLCQYVLKGGLIAVDGRLKLRTWEKDGKHGAALEVNADNVFLLGSKNDGQATARRSNDPEDAPWD